MLSNEKPSAVFKLGGRKDANVSTIALDTMMDDTTEPPITASLGISIEPQETVFAAVQSLQTMKSTSASDLVLSSSTPNGKIDVAAKLLDNLYK
ncbi:hypothetical protein HDU97_002939 [Phlyctochytrium planicorne]|nr:hypothetical protein HDU97_002939 [Phlyctochytrium planicorne]